MDKISVVLVEDDDLSRIGLRIGLQRQGNIIYLGDAANGEDGLNLLKTTQPDVAIVDIGLPDFDGIELTEKFKIFQTEKKEFNTKILILTLQDDENSVFAAFAAGANSYCMKNIRVELLCEVLKTTYEGNTWIDPAIARLVLSQAQQTKTRSTRSINTSSEQNLDYDKVLEMNPLTERELQVLKLIVDGYTNAAIAEKLYITIGTVKTHVRNILNKLCADDRTQAAVRAIRSGLVP
jgi:DNA-binding NarL/FixJ family response regulator